MPPEESHEPPAAEQQSRAPTILVVEDDAANREWIVLLMSTLPAYHYCLVSDAYQALHVTQRVKPDLFIVDYRLPGMNGLKLYDQLHATPGLEALPALLMIATRLEELRPEIEQRQLTAFEKPFDLDAFVLTVQRMLGTSPGETHADEGRT
ncbi:MAG TPA: response regulator [Ktedonobacteraceae bacterium]